MAQRTMIFHLEQQGSRYVITHWSETTVDDWGGQKIAKHTTVDHPAPRGERKSASADSGRRFHAW
jgi:hypothetical protein